MEPEYDPQYGTDDSLNGNDYWPEHYEKCEVCDDIVAECCCGENQVK